MKTKVAVFDYCETLVNMQTGNDFINFYIHRNAGIIARLAAYCISSFRIFKRRRKGLLLSLLSGESLENIERTADLYATQRLEAQENKNVIAYMKRLAQEGYSVIILSAGYSVYIESHNKKFKADKVIANDFCYVDSTFTGRLMQDDCYGSNKLKRLEATFSDEKIDFEESYFFSDCMSDLPLFKSFGKSFLVTGQSIVPFSENQVS